MSRDEIIAMAREAGCVSAEFWPGDFAGLMGVFERFAALVAAREREVILRTIDEIEEPLYTGYENQNTFDDGCIAVANAIQARSTP